MTHEVQRDARPGQQTIGRCGRVACRFSPWIAALAVPMAIGGCLSYHARPLTRGAVRKALGRPSPRRLALRASHIDHAFLRPVRLNPGRGLTPSEAALISVLINPILRLDRARAHVAAAQLVQAGILPNPQLSSNMDFVTGGNTLGTYTAYGLGLSWNVRELLTRGARISAAKAHAASVNLGIAWREWQVAQAARRDVYDLLAAREELVRAGHIDRRLQANYVLVRKAVGEGQMTALELAAADSARQVSGGTVLRLRELTTSRLLALRSALGLSPDATVRLRRGLKLPNSIRLPALTALLRGVRSRRLDLLALKQGYASQNNVLRAAILAQFPQINVGFAQGSDNTNVHSAGFGVTIDLPIFDRNQGVIAQARATRRVLFDQYMTRVFTARADIAAAFYNLRGLSRRIAAARAAIPALRRLVDIYSAALKRGNVDVLSYYAARNNLAQSRIELLRLKRLLADNFIALELATGRYLPVRADSRTRVAQRPQGLGEN